METQHDHLELAKQVMNELRAEFAQTNAMIACMASKADIERLEKRLDAHVAGIEQHIWWITARLPIERP